MMQAINQASKQASDLSEQHIRQQVRVWYTGWQYEMGECGDMLQQIHFAIKIVDINCQQWQRVFSMPQYLV